MKQEKVELFCTLGKNENDIDDEKVRKLIELSRYIFRETCKLQERDKRKITALLTKFCDAGRRSPPTAAFSKVVPGRPQSGADGNRIKRWLLDKEHKFYATEVDATLVEVKYILQALSMVGAYEFPDTLLSDSFEWLTGHKIQPSNYLDPIQLTPISLDEFFETPRMIQSGHIIPLDRGGKHVRQNAFLMLARSNQIQGNNSVPELLQYMTDVLDRHSKIPEEFTELYKKMRLREGKHFTNK